jgi:hypothetical protein
LPNGRGVLFTIVYPGQSDKGKVAVLDFATGQIKPLVDGARAAHYVESGHLVYAPLMRFAPFGSTRRNWK